jgi:hypothetical protein
MKRNIKDSKQIRVAPEDKIYQTKIFLNPMCDWHLRSHWDNNGIKEGGLIVYVVLGASVFNLWKLLSKDFMFLVFISLLFASPLAYYLMQQWLRNYQYRTELYLWIFAAAAIGALLITIITVSFQAIKAAVANPVKSLRTE